MSTFTSGSDPEPGDQVIPPASAVLGGFDEEHVRPEVERICGAPDMSRSAYELLATDDGLTDQTLVGPRRAAPGSPPLTWARTSGEGGLPGPRMVVHSLRSRPDT